jgi:multidrug efflux pump subunit AcrA (membrane-fusion protein)
MTPMPERERPAGERPLLVASPAPGSNSTLKKLLIGTAAAALIAAAWWKRPAQPAAPVAIAVPTARAVRGVIEPTRRIAGSIAAGRFANIAAPILHAPDQGRGLTLTYLANSGTRVKEGDVIAEIDTTAVVDHIDDVKADVAQLGLDIKRRKAVLLALAESMRQRVRVAKAALEKAREDLRALDARPPITQEYLRLALEEAQVEYDETAKQLPLDDERERADLATYELVYERQMRHLEQHLDDERRCKMRSPIGGMVVMQTVYRGGNMNQIKVGDQVSPGQPFMRVVDPASMQLEGAMSQSESELLRLGQPATVRFDAFPDVVAHGRVASVGAMAYSPRRINYWVRQVQVRVALDQQNARVIPDLTASADVVVADPAEGMIVPREALIENEGKLLVYVKHEGAFTAQEVEISGATNTQVAVTRGIQAGDEVALRVPE